MSLVDQIKIIPLLDTLRLQKISDEEYFSEQYSDYISNSRLGFINPDQEGNPQKFLDGFKENRIFSDSLTLGSQVHQLTLQPEYFELPPDLDRPTAKVGFIADELYPIVKKEQRMPTHEEFLNACLIVDYYKGNPSEKKQEEILSLINAYLKKRMAYESQPHDKDCTPYLDSKTLDKASGCINALKNNKKVQSLLHPTGIVEDPISECEQAILLDVEVHCPELPSFIVKLKSKLDNYTIDIENNTITVNDVKTIGRTLDMCDDQIQKYHYHREMAMYCYLLSECTKKFYNMEKFTIKSNFLWVSTIPTYYTKVTPMTSKLFKQGFNEFKDLLRRAAISIYFKDSEKAEQYINKYEQ